MKQKKIETSAEWAQEECTPMELLFDRFMESWAREKLEGIRKEIEEGKTADLVIPDEIEHIESDIFAGCENLKSVTFHSKVLTIGEHAFAGCNNLKSVTFNSKDLSIGEDAFAGCSSLKSIEIPENVYSVSSASFKDCTSVEHIFIPGKLLPSLSDIFEGCHAVSTLTLTSDIDYFKRMVVIFGEFLSAEQIAEEIAENMQLWKSKCSAYTKLTTLELTDKVTEIEPETLAGFTSLKAIKISKKNKVYQSEGKDKLIVEKNTGRLVYALSDDINGDVLGIGPSAFCGHKSLESIFIPKGVIKIDTHAFDGCDALKSIVVAEDNPVFDSRNCCNAVIETSSNTLVAPCAGTVLPKGVTDPKQLLLSQLDKSCEDLIIPEGITYIDNSTLAGFRYITSIEIPSTVVKIDQEAFMRHNALEYIKVSPENQVYDSRNGCNAIIETKTNALIVPSMNMRVPENVDIYSVGDLEYEKYNEAWDVLYLAQQGMTYDDSGTLVVNRPTSEELLIVLDWVRPSSIAFNADVYGGPSEDYYWWCRDLETIYIGKDVKVIQVPTFIMAYNLKNIVVNPENKVFDSRENCNAIIETATDTLVLGCTNTMIPDGIKCIRMFSCTGAEVKLPDSVQVIEDCAFYECENLHHINIPDGMTRIGDDAFFKCLFYDNVAIPDSVVEIGDRAFFGLRYEVQLPERFDGQDNRIFGSSEDVEDYFWDSLK